MIRIFQFLIAPLICALPVCAQTTVRSHVERFSATDARAELIEAESSALLADNPNDAQALNMRALARMKAESRKQKALDGNSGFQICNFKFQICDFKSTICCLLLSCDGATTGSKTNRDERRGAYRYYHYLLGREYFRVGFWEGATGEYGQAIEREPNNAAYVLALYDYARLAVKRSDYAESVVRLQRVIEKYPAHTQQERLLDDNLSTQQMLGQPQQQ